MAADLLTAAELGYQFGRSSDEIVATLRDLGHAGQKVKYGNGSMVVYDPAVVDVLAEAYAPEPEPDIPGSIAAVQRSIEQLALLGQAERAGTLDKLDTALGGLSTLAEQNRQLLRAIEAAREEGRALHRDVMEALGRLGAARHEASTLVPSPVQLPAPVGKPPRHNPALESARVTKPRVAIVGLGGAQQQTIDKEFGKDFDITYIELERANSANIASKVERCGTVFLVVSGHNGTILALQAAASHKLVRVNGLSSLKDKLTALWLAHAEAQPA